METIEIDKLIALTKKLIEIGWKLIEVKSMARREERGEWNKRGREKNEGREEEREEWGKKGREGEKWRKRRRMKQRKKREKNEGEGEVVRKREERRMR